MQKTSGNKIRLGIFVTVSIALFIVGIYFIGERQQLFNKTFRVSGIFMDISGLQVGNNVRFSGINVGIVENIQLVTDSTVKVDMMIDETAQKFIKKDAKAIIGSDGLMGNKIVIITPGAGSKQHIVDNGMLQTVKAVSMDDILIKIKVTADNAALITDDLAAIMQNIREGKGALGKLIMDSSLAQNVDAALLNIKQGTGGFKKNMDAASHNILLRGFFKKKSKEKDKAKEEEKASDTKSDKK